ncbi:MAG: CvpA family protein [Deltaproteobacteria bacterium]|nr:CvpA family protein [Deltaproteobacteria bacterium]
MNMADAAILIFWLVCLIRGIFRGPVNELFSIAGVLVGLFAAAFFYPPVSRMLSGWIASSPMRDLTCFLTIFGCMCLLMTVSGVIVTYLLHLRRSGWMNRASGAGLGLLKGMLFVAVLLVPLVSFLPKHSPWIGGSVIFPFENHLSEKMVHLLPSVIREAFSSHIGDYKQSWR